MPLPTNHLVIDWKCRNVTLNAALQCTYLCNHVGQLFILLQSCSFCSEHCEFLLGIPPQASGQFYVSIAFLIMEKSPCRNNSACLNELLLCSHVICLTFCECSTFLFLSSSSDDVHPSEKLQNVPNAVFHTGGYSLPLFYRVVLFLFKTY